MKRLGLRSALLRAARKWRNAPVDRQDRADQQLVELAYLADGHVDLRTLGAVPSAIHEFAFVADCSFRADLNLRHAVDELDECMELR